MTAFAGDGAEMLPDEAYEVSIVVSYYPGELGYEAPKVGDAFTIREAQNIVGFGEVLAVPAQ